MTEITLEHKSDYWIGRFRAMSGPCEVLMDVDDRATAADLINIAQAEALRIERKFSRYRNDNIIHRINHAHGMPIEVDHETAALLDYAAQCYTLSDGMFDITSGVLREVWRFNGSDVVPDIDAVAAVLPRIGWPQVGWQRPYFTLQSGMQIDFGGIGKEYAVDRSALLLSTRSSASMLVNYGGDLYATGERRSGSVWIVGLENPDHPVSTETPDSIESFKLLKGGLATSGDARRFLLKDGVRYGHILDPRSGWPVLDAPRSVTTVAASCTEAGILATLAMLHGDGAEDFLRAQGGHYWCLR